MSYVPSLTEDPSQAYPPYASRSPLAQNPPPSSVGHNPSLRSTSAVGAAVRPAGPRSNESTLGRGPASTQADKQEGYDVDLLNLPERNTALQHQQQQEAPDADSPTNDPSSTSSEANLVGAKLPASFLPYTSRAVPSDDPAASSSRRKSFSAIPTKAGGVRHHHSSAQDDNHRSDGAIATKRRGRSSRRKRRQLKWWQKTSTLLVFLALIIVVGLAVGLGVGLTVGKGKNNASSMSTPSGAPEITTSSHSIASTGTVIPSSAAAVLSGVAVSTSATDGGVPTARARVR